MNILEDSSRTCIFNHSLECYHTWQALEFHAYSYKRGDTQLLGSLT